jgi:hypothetical protein
VAGALLVALTAPLAGQRTTGSLTGSVRAADGSDVTGTHVTVMNTATGFTVATEVRHGRFLVQGLEVGGPYSVIVRRMGARPQQRDGLLLTLGAPFGVEFVLEPSAILLDPLHVSAPLTRARTGADGGIGHDVSNSLLHVLPTLNRNIYDFTRLAPQISTRIGFAGGGLSGGGAGFRFNDFIINGVSQRSIGGHVPAEFAGARSVPLEAVSEYQLLLAPFDVRFGGFTGALVNAVTRAGTNELSGSAFVYGRSDALARGTGISKYERLQYGFAAGGPILRDRLHFFVAPELQHLTAPAPGPYIGQPTTATPAVPVSAAELARVDLALRRHGLVAGSGGAVENRNPLSSVFGRLDLLIPEIHSRVVLSLNDSRSRTRSFSRLTRDASFPLTSSEVELAAGWGSAAFQLHTTLARGSGHNELIVGRRWAGGDWRRHVRQPLVRVAVPGASGGTVTVVTGTPRHAHVNTPGSAIQLEDHLALPLGAAHLVTLGVEVEWFEARRRGVENAYGAWDFANPDSLAAGVAEHFEVQRDLGGGSTRVSGANYAVYAGDRWRTGDRVSLTLGLRAELLVLHARAPHNAQVEATFGRRTDATPPRRVLLSPRVGFTWELDGAKRDRLRGGAGLFTGSAPAAWLHAPLYSYGGGTAVLRCGRRPTDLGATPPFVPDYRTPPAACTNGAGPLPSGEVELLDPRLRPPQSLRTALAYDRRLPGGLLGSVELMASWHVSDFVFANLNLAGPQGTDRHGRVLYGTHGPGGQAAPARRSGFSDVIELRNTSRNRAYQLAARLERPFSDGAALIASYTFSRVRDVQTPLRIYNPAIVNWASRAVSGDHADVRAGISLNDVPHRVVLALARRAPWRRWSTEISLLYTGESGSPFTYRVYGAAQRGDLNADGSAENDPIYVPGRGMVASETRFADAATAAQQAAAFEALIEQTPCLRRQRGRIVARNSCREPWSHTTMASVRQTLPVGGRSLQAQLDVYNLLNMIRSDWGVHRVADPALLEHVGQSADGTEPVFRFNAAAARWIELPIESSFQLQLALRYRF